MKYLTTKLSMIPITITDFINIIQSHHQLKNIEITSLMTSFDEGKIYCYEQTIAFQINQNHNYYEYIFNESDHELYISLEINHSDYIDLAYYLIDNHYLKTEEFSYSKVKIGKKENLDAIISFIENKTVLPVVYLNQSLHTYSQQLMDTLKTMAYVLTSEDQQFHRDFQKYFQLRNNSYIIYLNHEFQKISLLKNEDMNSFIYRIQIKVQNYITQRLYPFPYDMKSFQHFVIQKLIEENKENEDQEASHLEIQLSKLEDKKRELQNEIDHISKKIFLLENQNKELQIQLNQQKKIPLILKGDEKEFYEGEQKDMLLSLLEDEWEHDQNPMIQDILKQNPYVGNRKKYLKELFSMLVSDGTSKKNIDLLKHYGIYIDDSRKHPAGTFFNDSRYTITFSSTPGDVNAGRKNYRQIKNSFF